jgi:hypothetical protein
MNIFCNLISFKISDESDESNEFKNMTEDNMHDESS